MSVITITQSDIEAVFGAVFVAQWSNVGAISQSPTVNSTRVAAAIQRGQQLVNGRLSQGPYTTPLNATDDAAIPVEITDAMATLAGIWLFRTAGINYKKDTLAWIMENQKRVESILTQIRVGNYNIACEYNTGRRQTPAASW